MPMMESGMIKLTGLNKRYVTAGHEIWALRDVTLHVPKGSIFGIIGESGAGKSSLLRSVNMLEPPTSGEVLVDGHNMTVLSQVELLEKRRKLGMIFQHFNLLASCNVYDNIALPLKFIGADKKTLETVIPPLINLVGLTGREQSYPHQLSGGQKQRVAIARALATKPNVLLSDEATSALDQKTTESILDLLVEINEKTGLTILLITHELDVIKAICHNVALMDHGQIVESGPVVDFFSAPKTPLAKQLVERSLKMHLPMSLRHELSEHKSASKQHPLVRIVFRGQMVKEAIISQASRLFLVDISIAQSNIEFIGKSVVGFLVAEIRGDELSVTQVLEFFKTKQLDFQVVGYVS
jgi:D-methionine transport system ATP-binding protein